jgi:hypothetical protein
MAFQIAFALYPICLAAVAIFWALRAARTTWFVEIAAAASIAAFAFLAGPWAFTSYYLRYAVPVLFVLAAVYALRRPRGKAGRLALSIPVLLLFAGLDAGVGVSHVAPRESFNVPFPLAAGEYYVLQGGNSVVTNSFHASVGSTLALDIVRLNAFGNRAKGIAPRALGDYEIFGDTVYSPCAGSVIAVQGGRPDHAPGQSDPGHVNGNHVVLRCGDVEILLAHMRQGSVVVSAGETVALGRAVGKVGNSGYSMEPHLHVGAKRGGKEVGLVFDNRQLSVNSLVVGVHKK